MASLAMAASAQEIRDPSGTSSHQSGRRNSNVATGARNHDAPYRASTTSTRPTLGYRPKHEKLSFGQRAAAEQAARHRATMDRQIRRVAYETSPDTSDGFNRVHEAADQNELDRNPDTVLVGGYNHGDNGDGEAVYHDEAYPDEFMSEGEYSDGGCGGGCSGGYDGEVIYDDCCGADACCGGGCGGNYCGGGGCGGGSMVSYLLQNTTLFAGVHGFTGPGNLSSSGSFGFHEGINMGAPAPFLAPYGVGMQFGVRTLQSNLSGSGVTSSQRNQSFFTAGLFRRTDWGLQGGVVFDLLRDRWYDAVDLSQVRGEISWKHPCYNEFGYWFAVGDRTDQSTLPDNPNATATWETTELHAFFYRRRLRCLRGGLGRFYAGFTGDRDGLVGADTRIPFNSRWSLDSHFTYLVPEQATNNGGTSNESWNVGITLVMHLGNKSCCDCGNYFEPLLNVADNGNFMVDQIFAVAPAGNGAAN